MQNKADVLYNKTEYTQSNFEIQIVTWLRVILSKLHRFIFNIYIWCLRKTNIYMLNNDRYIALNAICKQYFEGLIKYLEALPKDSYIKFVKTDLNTIEFSVGYRRVLISHEVDINKFMCRFKVHEISPNKEDYGKYKLIEMPQFAFNNIEYKMKINEDGSEDILRFPDIYINEIEKGFDTI